VPLVARLVDQVAGTGLDDVVAEERAHAALEHEAVLVLAVVAVQRRRQPARRHRVLDEAEAAVRVRARDHEAHTDGLERHGLPVGGADDRRRAGREHGGLLHEK
jgi:hypothetical protein